MTNTKDKKYNVWKGATVSFLKIIGIVVCAFFFVITTLFSLFPSLGTEYYNILGLKKAEELCYERQYQKTDNIADLYNLVVFEQDKNNIKQLQYINELMNKKGYADFCRKLNNSALSKTSEKSLIAYAGDVHAYLVNQKVKCLYELNISAETFIYSCLKTDNITEQSFASFVELVRKDDVLSKERKIQKYEDLLNTFEADGQILEVLLNNRLLDINNKLGEMNLSENEKIILQYSLMNDYRACYIVYHTIGNEVKTSEFETKYNDARNEYNNLIK